jgi:dipeptidyl aminopeptidase/acylaminoacyl peptidase
MNEVPVTLRSEGKQVVGMLHRPPGRGPFPAVVFLHGFSGNSFEAHRLFLETARVLTTRGVASLRFDFRGSGNSAGAFSDLSIQTEIADARAAVRWVRKQPWADSRRLALLGMSMGGLVATQVLAADRALRTAVLWNPVVYARALRDGWMNPARAAQLKKSGVADWFGWPVGRALYDDLGRIDPLACAPSIRCPLLVVQATDDQTTPKAGGCALVKSLQGAGVLAQLQLIPGSDHCFGRFDWTQQAIQASVDYLGSGLAD